MPLPEGNLAYRRLNHNKNSKEIF